LTVRPVRVSLIFEIDFYSLITSHRAGGDVRLFRRRDRVAASIGEPIGFLAHLDCFAQTIRRWRRLPEDPHPSLVFRANDLAFLASMHRRAQSSRLQSVARLISSRHHSGGDGAADPLAASAALPSLAPGADISRLPDNFSTAI
jgi:hypothetical protein